MQVFIPYPEPIEVAKCLDKRRLNKQIVEGEQIISAALGYTKAWANHPVVKMYSDHLEWLRFYIDCLEFYRCGRPDIAKRLSDQANICRPKWMTKTLCNSHKRRLVAKDAQFYKKFWVYGISEINYYVVDNKVLGYAKGKCIITQTLEEFNNGKA